MITTKNELITPEIANKLLESNTNNRSLTPKVVQSYANDMKNGNWDEQTGSTISIDWNGVLRDGQHRLAAVVMSGVAINMNVCRGVSPDGIYDNCRPRTIIDQIRIKAPDLEAVYKGRRYQAIAKLLVAKKENRSFSDKVSPSEILNYTYHHKKDLDGFFGEMPKTNAPKIATVTVWVALYLAYINGVEMSRILSFYDVLRSGMSTKAEEFPIISYRNYLQSTTHPPISIDEISRCQYALKKYLTKSCSRTNRPLNQLIWGFPND